MRILAITMQNSAVGYHRLMMPIYYLEKSYAHFTDILNDEILEQKFDIVIMNRYCQTTHINDLIAYRKKYGFKLIIDIDDYWILDPWHILKDQYDHAPIIDHIKIADLVTCTHEALRNKILPFNKNVEILPNALPYGKDQFTDVTVPGDKVRIVYAGSITHEKDLRIVQNPFKKILHDKLLCDKLYFTICGYNDANQYSDMVWQRMIAHFTCGLKLPGQVRKHLPHTEYMNFYNDADISIVPLEYSTFNSLKSNLKVLEAACKKIPVIVSNVPPYDTCPHVIHINKQTDWYKSIKKLANDAIYRKELGEANYEWCYSNFNLDKINILRKQIYSSLCQ